MFLEDLVKAANGLLANFWLVVIVLLPFIMLLAWIIKWFEANFHQKVFFMPRHSLFTNGASV